jgi:AcrR family transcriptional regulator
MTNIEPLRRQGRPDQQASEDLVRHIVETATRLFIEQGYAATSLEQIAAVAGSGKQTLYRRFGSKAELFQAIIEQQTRRLAQSANAALAPDASPLEALKQCIRAMFDFVLTDEALALQRVMIGECGRFPELGKRVLESCAQPFQDLLNKLVRAARDAGEIEASDLDQARDLLFGLVTGWPVHQSLFAAPPFADDAARDAWFEAAWALYARGMAPERKR